MAGDGRPGPRPTVAPLTRLPADMPIWVFVLLIDRPLRDVLADPFVVPVPLVVCRDPVGPTFTMMSPNSSVVVSRPTVSIGISKVCPGRAGGSPTTPAGASRF